MEEKERYGTVAHWFGNQKLGSIKPLDDDEISENILLITEHMPDYYLLPQVGDELRYQVSKDDKNRNVATNIELLPAPKEGGMIKLTLKLWDRKQNGGYGIYGFRTQAPVFALGQFLRDPTRIPEAGDVIQGRLKKHQNDQWLITDIEIIDTLEQPRQEQDRYRNDSGYAPNDRGKNSQIEQAADDSAQAGIDNADTQKSKQKPALIFPAFTVLTGKIVRWDDEKGFGFIQSGVDSKEVFFHITAYHYRYRRPKVGEIVRFYCNRPIVDAKQQAVRVVLKEHEASLSSNQAHDLNEAHVDRVKLLLAVVLGGGYLYWVYSLSEKLAAAYGVVSLIALWYYNHDKSVAIANANRRKSGYQGRTPENTLHQIGLLGGWPGAWVARALFNHKTSKASFVRTFWLMVVLNVALTAALLILFPDNPVSVFLKNPPNIE